MKWLDCQVKKLWLINKFSLSVPKEMYREQYGEYVYWCLGVKDKSICSSSSLTCPLQCYWWQHEIKLPN